MNLLFQFQIPPKLLSLFRFAMPPQFALTDLYDFSWYPPLTPTVPEEILQSLVPP